MATKVTLREKKISKGRKSLYLDFYPPILNLKTGKPTRREFLGIYIYEKATSPLDKQYNKEQLKLANEIWKKRTNILNKPEIYTEAEAEKLKIIELGKQCFIEYFKELVKERKGSNYDNWSSTVKYLEDFTNGSIQFAELNEKTFRDFKKYLLTTTSNKSKSSKLSINSASSYFNKVKAALKQAYKDGNLQTDLNAKIEPIKPEETQREYLTIQELNKLVKTPCSNPILKRAALFSALTGLRFSDIKKMVWSELEYIEGQGYLINFRQKKTKGLEIMPISEQAYNFLEGTNNPKEMPQDEIVFKGLKYSAHQNKYLKQWIEAAEITKDITFHNFRHTYATLQLFNGADIYTVSKMLGHKDLKTTQIYTKIVDEAKRKTTNNIVLDL